MIPVSRPPKFGKADFMAVENVLKSGNLHNGEYTGMFEERFADYVGKKHGIACSNGTTALYTALKSIGVGRGDEVIVPPLTFFSTILAVLHTGAKPVFADIDEDTWCLDATKVNGVISSKTKAVIPVDIFGNPCEMEEFIAWQSIDSGNLDFGYELIQDCAQSHGAIYSGYYNVKSGLLADIACYSFMGTKNLTVGGEGGMILTNSDDIESYCRKFLNYGMSDRHTHDEIGINGHIDEIRSAIGLTQLEKLEDYLALRRYQANMYDIMLKDVSWLIPQKIEDGNKSSYFWYACYIDESELGLNAAELHHELYGKGIETRYRYTEPLYYQPCLGFTYRKMKEIADRCPNAERVCGNVIGLPIGEHLTDFDQEKVCDVIKSL